MHEYRCSKNMYPMDTIFHNISIITDRTGDYQTVSEWVTYTTPYHISSTTFLLLNWMWTIQATSLAFIPVIIDMTSYHFLLHIKMLRFENTSVRSKIINTCQKMMAISKLKSQELRTLQLWATLASARNPYILCEWI